MIKPMKVSSAVYPCEGYRRTRLPLRRKRFELCWSHTHRRGAKSA